MTTTLPGQSYRTRSNPTVTRNTTGSPTRLSLTNAHICSPFARKKSYLQAAAETNQNPTKQAMSRAEYLQKYLTKDDPTKKKTKKRKRKETGVVIADDDVLGWDNNKGDVDEDDPVTSMVPRPTHTAQI